MYINRQLRLGAPALLLGALLLGGPAPASNLVPAGQSVDCQIRTERRGGLLFLEALTTSRSSISGHYVLAVSKHSAGGSSQSLQQGDFFLRSGVEVSLATTAVEASAAGHVTAILTLEWNQGKSTCMFPR